MTYEKIFIKLVSAKGLCEIMKENSKVTDLHW